MHILVTGGAGFIGSHLCEALLGAGRSVTVLDDLSTGDYANIAHLEGKPDFRAFIGSIDDEPLVESLVEKADLVMHLAAAVGVRLVVEKPTRTIETNILGTNVVMRCAARFRKKIVLASTSEVYGCSEREQFGEDDDMLIGAPPKLRWSYAASKAIDEFLAMAYYQEQKLPTVVVRLFNTVGPRQTGRYGMVIPRFIDQALTGLPLTVYGDGSQSRCFTSVLDVVEALMKLAACPAAEGRVVNIGSHNEITIAELARRIIELTGSDSTLQFIPYEDAYGENFQDMLRRKPDISRLKELTGFVPSRSLDDILHDAIAYARDKKSHGR